MKQPNWKQVREYGDITYHKCGGVARIAINRPEVRNAFRPETLFELQEAFRDAGEDMDIGVVLFTGNGRRRTASTRSPQGVTSACAATPGTWAETAYRG